MRHAGIRSFATNSGYILATYVVTTLIAFGYSVVLTRALGRGPYGTLVFGFAWYLTFIAFSYLGLEVVLGREIGRAPQQAPRLSGSTFVARGVAALICAVVSSTIGAIVTDGTTRVVLFLFSIALLLRAIWVWCTSIFVASERSRLSSVGDFICRPLEPAFGILVLHVWPHSVVGVAVVHTVVWGLQAAIGMALVSTRVTHLDFRFVRRDARRIVRSGVSGWLYSLTVVWFTQAPIVLYRVAVGVRDIGTFGLAIQILGYLLTIPYLAGSIALPILARSASRGDGKARRAALISLTLIPAIGVVLGALTLTMAPTVCEVVFGAAFRQTGVILGAAIWLMIPMSIAVAMQQVSFSNVSSRAAGPTGGLIGIALMALVFVPLTRSFGYDGALLASGVGMVAWAAGATWAALGPTPVRERVLARP